MGAPHEITNLIERLGAGEEDVEGRLFDLLYEELRTIAGLEMRRERAHHTLQPTALLNEAWIKLAHAPLRYHNRKHFLRLAAQAMRQVLVDHARARLTRKRDGGHQVPMDAVLLQFEHRTLDILTLNELLEKLGEVNAKLPPVVLLRFFGGLSMAEIASELQVNERTVERRWKLARGWLRCEVESLDHSEGKT